jgi:hypothetical protein
VIVRLFDQWHGRVSALCFSPAATHTDGGVPKEGESSRLLLYIRLGPCQSPRIVERYDESTPSQYDLNSRF